MVVTQILKCNNSWNIQMTCYYAGLSPLLSGNIKLCKKITLKKFVLYIYIYI